MTKKKSKMKELYLSLGPFTKFFIKISLLFFLWTIILGTYCYLIESKCYKFDLYYISFDLLNMSKSILGTGFLGTLMLGSIEKTEPKENKKS